MDTAQADALLPNATGDRDAVQTIVTALKEMIAHELDVRIDEKAIDPTVPLLEGGLMLDSMVLFELITLIEKRYGIAFPTENLNSEVFANLTVLSQYIVAEMRRAEPGSVTTP